MFEIDHCWEFAPAALDTTLPKYAALAKWSVDIRLQLCLPQPNHPFYGHYTGQPSVLWRCWLGGRKGIRPVKTEWWGAGVVVCLEQGADLHMAQLMPLPLTVSCFSTIQTGFTFLVPAHLGSPGKRAVKRVCVCVYGSTSVSWHLQLRNVGFCWCKVSLPTCPCWWHLAHSDYGQDAGVLLNSVIYTVSIPQLQLYLMLLILQRAA